ncbi:ABC-2 type transport system permease protein [Lactobacillus colini]|uniref:ABC-2 type transport system permease protein n=1 Tax=Lactobacillus colini TaxID=1819254 RepID=A0ABS4MFU5_9LACO|nr:hypothetical protein [Lactobacillus colini]MBP2058556.1 ABC-2 type transport system permease protein [Lactobacillus colini]
MSITMKPSIVYMSALLVDSMELFFKTRSFIKFYAELAIDNKMNLIFTLVFPIVYQLISVKASQIFTIDDFIKVSIPMIAYIIVSTALNGVTMSIIATRNSGYIKAYYYASGSKWAIYLANLLVQLVIVVLENIVFILGLMILYNFYSLRLLICLILMNIITFPVVSMGFNILFLFPIRQSSLSILATSLLIGFLILFNINVPNFLEVIKLINLYVFISFVLQQLITPDFKIGMYLITITSVYLSIGILGYQHFKLQDRGRED